MGRLRHPFPHARRRPLAGQTSRAPGSRSLVGGSADWPFEGEWQGFGTCWAETGRLHLFFLSGAQIDGQGNINLMAVGDYHRPQLRLPGRGRQVSRYSPTWWRWPRQSKTAHEPRGLVPHVDVITAPGFTPHLSASQRPGRITRLVTPRCVLAFNPPEAPALESLHPGETLGISAPAHRL